MGDMPMKPGAKGASSKSVKAGPIKVMGSSPDTYKTGKGKKKTSLKSQAKKVSFK